MKRFVENIFIVTGITVYREGEPKWCLQNHRVQNQASKDVSGCTDINRK